MRLVVLALLPAVIAGIAYGGGDGFTETRRAPEYCRNRGDFYPVPDNVAIANEILTETTDEPLFDRAARDELAAEVASVLSAVRAAYPTSSDVRAVPRGRWQIEMGFEGHLADRIQARGVGPYGRWVSRTGDKELDRLGKQLGLAVLDVRDLGGSGGAMASACFREMLNAPATVARFEELESVKDASLPSIIGDTPALDLREVGDTWLVAVREASGPCTAGCGNVRLSFFNVEDGAVTTVAESDAARDPVYRRLVTRMSRGYSEGWISPTPTP